MLCHRALKAWFGVDALYCTQATPRCLCLPCRQSSPFSPSRRGSAGSVGPRPGAAALPMARTWTSGSEVGLLVGERLHRTTPPPQSRLGRWLPRPAIDVRRNASLPSGSPPLSPRRAGPPACAHPSWTGGRHPVQEQQISGREAPLINQSQST